MSTGFSRLKIRLFWMTVGLLSAGNLSPLAYAQSPTPVPNGLTLWLKADAIQTSDSTQVRNASGVLSVIKWIDQSGHNAHGTQTVANWQPRYLPNTVDGKPAVRFDGVNDHLSTSLPQIAGDKSIFVVQRRTSSTTGTEISSGSSAGMFLANSGGAETEGRLGIAHDISLDGCPNQFVLKSFIRSGAVQTLRVNDTVTQNGLSDSAGGTYTVSSYNYAFGGDIVEILIYNRSLSDSERLSVESYLKSKWPSSIFPLSAMRLWLDAATINGADANQVRTVNSTKYVQKWGDRRLNNAYAIQTNPDGQPTYQSGSLNKQATVRFDGVNDFLSSNISQTPGDHSIFVVHKRTSTNTGVEVSSTALSGFFLGNNQASETKGRLGIAHDLALPGGVGTAILKSYVRSNSVETLRVNKSITSSTIPDGAGGNYLISDPSWPFAGDIAEIIVYDRTLTDSERVNVENYLTTKWAISGVTLPVTNGLRLLLEADAIDPTDSNQVRASNGSFYVKDWVDQSRNRFDAIQTSTTAQPAYIPAASNQAAVVRFDGSNDVLNTNLPQIAGDKSLFVIYRRTNLTTGTEISSTAGVGFFSGNNSSFETVGRLGIAHDLAIQGATNTLALKSIVRSGTTLTLRLSRTLNPLASASVPDSATGSYSISDALYPLAGDVAEVVIYNRALSDSERQAVEQYLTSKWGILPLDDIRSVPPDLALPPLTAELPAAGKRVKQTSPEYAGTQVYHTLYLPPEWTPGGKYPVIVEYGPNEFYPPNGDIITTGKVDDASLAFGITGGTGYILISMPTIGGNPLANQLSWWGDIAASKDYCLKTIRHVCEDYGGDPAAVVLAGFSRGAIACNYLGLNDDTIADVWLGFIPHAHYDGQITTWGYPNADATSAKTRLQRLNHRRQHISHELTLTGPESYLQSTGVDMSLFNFSTLPYVNHTDIWTLRPIQLQEDTLAWLQALVQSKPGTHTLRGRVLDASGNPLSQCRIQSGYTHFTFTDASGNYVLPGIIDSTRTVSASANGYTFADRAVTVSGADVSGVDFRAQP